MRIRVCVTRRLLFAGRWLEPGDLISLDTQDTTAIVAVELPYNPGALAGLLADGAVDPIAMTPSAAVLALQPASPGRSRVLPFRRARSERQA